MIEIVALSGGLIVVALVVGFLLGRRRRKVVENRGEAAIRRTLTKNFREHTYHLLNNLTLPFEGGTTQIDHVLLSRYGIFVIESKHYSGWIFANESGKTWTQVIYRYKNKFQNPLRQNYRHVKAIEELLDFVPPEHIHNLVAFTGSAEFKTMRPPGVYYLSGLVQYIEQFTKNILTENRLQFCVGRLECYRKIISGKTDIEHQEYLNRRHGNVA